ncbi:MAG: type I restriction enzyme HsdR N-terminal domain-containing protein [Anaerolineaceae bacterium]|nr:type I restriction enzyme HsdR N-terminal domain-containing protein [Anaerolineaceae bacterium]
MSENLLRAIVEVQNEIQSRPGSFQREQQTIRSLIDPILIALEWRTNDHERVEHEFPVGENKHVDMALKRNGEHIALLEAKALGRKFGAKEFEQVSEYCFHTGVQTAILTNGAEWIVFRPQQLEKLHFKNRRLFGIDLGQKEMTAKIAAQKLKLISYEKIDSLEHEAWRVMLEEYWEEHALQDLLNPFATVARRQFAKRIKKKSTEVPLEVVRKVLQKKLGQEPSKLVFQEAIKAGSTTESRRSHPDSETSNVRSAVVIDGETLAAKYMTEVLQQVVNWLVKQGHVNPEECPIFVRDKIRTRYLIHTQPKHPNGRMFFNGKRLSNGLYLETHASKQQIWIDAHRLLERYNYDPRVMRLVGFKID